MKIIVPIEGEQYSEYIQRILNARINLREQDSYQERHHIIPKCLGGSNEDSNLVWLYAQEHYYAHKLLALENPDNQGLQYAWWMMSHQNNYFVTQEEYSEVRRRFSEIHSNREVSSETREKLSKLHKGKHLGPDHWNYGRHRSQKTKEQISQSRMGKYTGAENPNAKKVMCNETQEVFPTLKDAASAFGVSLAAISNNCHGHSKRVLNKYTFTIL